MKTNNIAQRILIPLGVTLFFLLTIAIISIYWLQRMHLDEKIEKRLKEVEQLFQMKQEEDSVASITFLHCLHTTVPL